MIMRGLRYKLLPTPEQETQFRQYAGVCRLVYNAALEQRRDYWRQYRRATGKNISYGSQAAELTALRSEVDWIAAVSQTAQQQALRDLDRTYSNFFKGLGAYPTPRRKGVNDAFRFQGRDLETKRLNAKRSAVRLPKIGWVKFRDTRPLRGAVKNAAISLDALGWHISFACEVEHTAPANSNPSLGIDRGVANTLALSAPLLTPDGETQFLSLPDKLEKIERRKRRAQRVSARRKRGSRRRMKQLRRRARLSARQARIRNDWQHRQSRLIAEQFGDVALEDLKIKNMTASAKGTLAEPGRNVRQKAGLNCAILAQGWGSFANKLAYKLEERGGTLVKVDPAYTSQTCSACGAVDRESRENQARFACRSCGFEAHADSNAAVNILRRNTAFMRMEEGHWLSGEVRTRSRLPPSENPPASAGGRC